ncbi:hypothetical protein ACEU6E_07285 [Halorutilales archaeon Cl-col2-1]
MSCNVDITYSEMNPPTYVRRLLLVCLALAFILTVVTGSATASRGLTDEDYGNRTITLNNETYTDVFQGEEDIIWKPDDLPGVLYGIEGIAAEGERFEITTSVPQAQETGKYAERMNETGYKAEVISPEVREFETYNEGMGTVGGGEIATTEAVLVTADWNFMKAEDIELTVTSPAGTDITDSVLVEDYKNLSDSQIDELNETDHYNVSTGEPEHVSNRTQGLGRTSHGIDDPAYWGLNFTGWETGSYEITVEGSDDLTFGDASSSESLSVVAEKNPSLSLDSGTATQGERVGFTVTESDDGIYHSVAVGKRDIAEGYNIREVFELVGDDEDGTVNITTTPDYVVATVAIDGSTGEGLIDTRVLKDKSVDFYLFAGNSSQTEAFDEVSTGDYIDSAALDVSEPEVRIQEPWTYVPGERTYVNGTTSSSISSVSVYVRDSSDWYLLSETLVEGESWSVERFVPSDPDDSDVLTPRASEILSYTGTYSIGVIETSDARRYSNYTVLNDTEFFTATSDFHSIEIVEPSLSVDTYSVDGEVSTSDDSVHISGSALGNDDVVVALFDRFGATHAERLFLSSRDRIDERIEIPDSFSQGRLELVVIASGRDGEIGDGRFSGGLGVHSGRSSNTSSLTSLINDAETVFPNANRPQIVERVLAESVNETGSDDLVHSGDFSYTDPSLEIHDIAPVNASVPTTDVEGIPEIEVGEEVVVRGSTNLDPDENTIEIKAVDGPSANEFDIEVVDTWQKGRGFWLTTVETDGLKVGSYEIVANAGVSSDTVELELVGEREMGLDQTRPRLSQRLDSLKDQIEAVRGENRRLQRRVEDLSQTNSRLESRVEAAESENARLKNTSETVRQRNQELRSELGIDDDGEGGEGLPGFGVPAAIVALLVVVGVTALHGRSD